MMFTTVPAEEAHMAAVCDIEENSFAIPWTEDELRRDFMENKHAVYLTALAGEDVVGYASFWHIVNEGHINTIAVGEKYRRMGAGSLLMEAVIREAEKREIIGLTLEVRAGNRAAMGLYHKYGFKAEGYRKNYYADTKEDAVIMWKYLRCEDGASQNA